MPLECNKLAVGSVTGIFCPELRYLFHTEQISQVSLNFSDNLILTEEKFKDIKVYSFSSEAEYVGSMILLLNGSEVWRVTATHSVGDHQYELTLIFKLRVLQDVRAVEVFDDFALVIFEDESVLLAVRPDTEGDYAKYNTALVDVGSTARPSLFLEETPIEYYSIVPDTSKTYNYLLNMLTVSNASG
jgi:hypothetical protein